jgi:hypothetical protein
MLHALCALHLVVDIILPSYSLYNKERLRRIGKPNSANFQNVFIIFMTSEDVTPRTPTGAAEEYHRKDSEVQAALRQDEARKRCRL